jgi:regulator of protease activity HflC (stomatin/prohibitin superfamily)
VQVTLTYRIADPERAAARVNFSIALENGQWLDRPLDKLATFWAQRALQPARTVVTQAPLEATLQRGAEAIHAAIVAALDTDPELPAMGLKLVGVLIEKIAPSADVEKALQTPTREAIQAKADEAQYQRRALAVEKERAIKENELATQIELERQQEMLIRKAGENAMLKVEQENAAAHARASADAERLKINAAAAAEAARTAADAALEEERKRHGIWKDTPPGVLAGLVLSRFADNIQSIGHLNITPELLSQSLAQMLRDAAAPAAGGAR